MGISLINPSTIKTHCNDTISQKANICVAAIELKKNQLYTRIFLRGMTSL